MNTSIDILRLIDKIDDEAFIINNTTLILYSNEAAKKSLPANFSSNKFFDLFLQETNDQFENLLEEIISNSKEITKALTIKYSNGIIKECDVKISQYKWENNKIVFLVILTKGKSNLNGTQQVKLLLSNKEITELINNVTARKIIDDVKSNFPFTLIGKNNIQHEINKLNEFFWIKDGEGKYIIVNQKFAQSLGLKTTQVEGRYEKEFLPNYLVEFSQSVSNYIGNTSNVIIREGISFPYHSNSHTFQVIEFPICDLDNRILAIIGMTQFIGEKNAVEAFKYSEVVGLAFENLSKPILILDNKENIKIVNSGFAGLFPSLQLETQVGENYNILPDGIRNLINKFIIKDSDEEKAEIEVGKTNTNQLSFVFNLRKLYNSDGELVGYLILVEESLADLIQTIKKDRGKMYELIIQNSPEAMFVYEVDNLKFLDVNQTALDLYGYSRDEFLQMDLTDLYSPEDIQTLLDKSEKKVAEKKFTGPWRHKKKNGSAFFVEISKTTFDYKGKKAHFNLIKDVTEKLELEKKIQLYKASFDNTPDLLFITDAEGFISYVNEQVNSVLDYSGSELENRPFITLASDEDRIKINSEVFGVDLKKPIKLNAILKKKNNDLIETEIVATPIFDFNNQISSFNLIVHPLAKEQELAPQKESTDKIAETKAGGFELSQSFLSSIFHEILTPMNVILGFVQELTENISAPTPEQKEAIEIIDQNREVLLQTMDSLLEYSHIVQNKAELKTEKFLFTDIIDNLQKSTQKIAKTNKIEFTYGKISSSLSLESDKHKMESLLSMFISSAMRITKEKKIYVSAYQYDDENYFVSIKDNRKGVSKFLLDHINNIFTTEVGELKKDFGISKLKLKLMNKLTELLKGKYESITRGNEVTEVGFIFPLEFKVIEKKKEEVKTKEIIEPVVPKEEKEIEAEEPVISQKEIEEPVISKVEEIEPVMEKKLVEVEPEPVEEIKPVDISYKKEKLDLSQLSCLYVEDQVDSQILFKVQMKELKLVDFAVSFEAALPLLDQKKYDFIIIDINLQGEYNGLDALRIIRKMPGFDKTKIIAVTAYVLPGDKEKFVAAGFNDFISKPILREKLVDSFEKMIAIG